MRALVLNLFILSALLPCASAWEIHETFEPPDFSRFITPLPNKNSEVRKGTLWTRGSSGGKYPPMVYLGVEAVDLSISFRYRHLGPGGWLWFFVDGDDGFGGTDHMLRVKLLRDGVQLQVDGHSKDPAHPQRQIKREADRISGAYRLNESLPKHPLPLQGPEWHEVRLVFRGEEVQISVNGQAWSQTLTRPGFKETKHKLLWMQNGGAKGIELDDIHILPAPTR